MGEFVMLIVMHREGLWLTGGKNDCASWTTFSPKVTGRGTRFRGQEFISFMHGDVIPCNADSMAFLCIQSISAQTVL
jgi:hypothetical protein